MSALAFVLVAAGVLLLLVAAAGLFLLPDALARQHAATKSGTLALGLILVGAAVYAGDAGWAWRVAAILALLVVTLPVASHMLARAAARHAYSAEELGGAARVVGKGAGGTGEPRR
ncbi:MAG: monovalent cation/H(+) antiporter subunit G [Xanthomonadales bacterium]|jgi:multicomponent Na+:H+ antiporter subunit G|nr:monovalent cation/H(+) antiporter subunit G [Xanthomonadales bacterium]